MWLALQDIVLESEISKSIQILSKIGNYKKAKRTLIIVTDTDWDIKGLKDHKGQPANEKNIIAKAKTVFDDIFAFSGSDNLPPFVHKPEFYLNQLVSAKTNILFFNSGLNICNRLNSTNLLFKATLNKSYLRDGTKSSGISKLTRHC